MEHASVASFARFTLQLLALGAPPELLLATQRAAADEVRHATLAWGLASAYAGAELGPGPLDLIGAAPALDPAGILRALIEEACVGEVVGAAEASEAASGCEDTVVREVLETVAADEARHAALAWRALRWLLAEVAPELKTLAEETLNVAIRRAVMASDALPDRAADGVPGAERILGARRAAVAQVVLPAAAALGLRVAFSVTTPGETDRAPAATEAW